VSDLKAQLETTNVNAEARHKTSVQLHALHASFLKELSEAQAALDKVWFVEAS
jgi:hypothetical protein